MASLAVTKTNANFFKISGVNSALPKYPRKVNNPFGTTMHHGCQATRNRMIQQGVRHYLLSCLWQTGFFWFFFLKENATKSWPIINASPSSHRQNVISQSARADETHHSFGRHFYPAVLNYSFPVGEVSLTKGAGLMVQEREKRGGGEEKIRTRGP